MTRRFNAHFRNGVLIPDEKVELPENRTLTISVDEVSNHAPQVEHPRHEDPNDPMPEGGVELCAWWTRHRIQIDPAIAREIAENPEFDIENS